MKEIFKKHNKTIKFFLFAFCFIVLAGKIIYDFSPLLLMKSAFVNTLNKHKADYYDTFKGSNRIIADMCYKTSNGDNKIIYALFDDSVVGFSLNGADSVYYTIPIDNIKKILKSDYLNNMLLPQKTLYKSSSPVFIIPSLFNLKLNENIDLKFFANAFSNVKLFRSKGTLLSNEKNFSFLMPSETISEIIGNLFRFETDFERMLKLHLTDIVYVKDGDYLFDIEISSGTLKSIQCITPSENGSSYGIQINLNYPKICLSVKKIINQSEKCILSMKSAIYETQNHKVLKLSIENDLYDEVSDTIIFTLSFDKGQKKTKYREKSIYSLTLGELIEISKKVSDGI